jgi:hypothetical protein
MDEFTKYDTFFRNVWTHGISDGDIREALITVSEDTWNQLKANRNEYCSRVKELIQDQMDYESYEVSTIRVVDMDNETWLQMEHAKRDAYEQKSLQAWNSYKKQQKLQCPRSALDDQRDTIMQDIERLKKSLADVQAVQATKYLPPSQRRAEPPKNKLETELIAKIGVLQNELKQLGDKRVREQNDWDYYARRDFEEQEFIRSNKAYYGL